MLYCLGFAAHLQGQGSFFPATYASDLQETYSAGVVVDSTVSGIDPGGYGLCYGNAYQAQYYIGPANTIDENSFVPVGPQAGFLGSSATDKAGGAGYLEGNGNQPSVTSFAGSSVVTLQLRVWKGDSSSTFAGASIRGTSPLYQFTLGSAGSPNRWSQQLTFPPSPVTYSPTFANVGPEPATITLGLMGAGALFVRRSKDF